MNAFYNRVDELCVKKGLTHRRLAGEIGVDEVTLSRYLTGERKCQLMPFMAMCRILGVEPNDLYQTYLFARMEDRVARYRAEREGKA